MDLVEIQRHHAECEERRKTLPHGPWMIEPHRLNWKSPSGLDCMVIRNPIMYHWCGYAGVPKGHKLFGQGPHDDLDLDVHGGITYGEACSGHICHVADKEVWWLGFDCCHAGDLSPGMLEAMSFMDKRHPEFAQIRSQYGVSLFERDHYWSMGDVEVETERLAEQIAGMS